MVFFKFTQKYKHIEKTFARYQLVHDENLSATFLGSNVHRE